MDTSRAVPCKCVIPKLKKEQDELQLRMCQLPAATEGWTFAKFIRRDFSTKQACDAAWNLAQEAGDVRWLTLMADVNRGKSHLAVAICREWLKRGRPARYAYVPDLLDELRASIREDANVPYHQQFDFFCKVELLVLDDLGAEKVTDWVAERLRSIVDYRYRQGLPLVVTSNVPLEELDRRIESRLRRADGARLIVIEAKEFGKTKAHCH